MRQSLVGSHVEGYHALNVGGGGENGTKTWQELWRRGLRKSVIDLLVYSLWIVGLRHYGYCKCLTWSNSIAHREVGRIFRLPWCDVIALLKLPPVTEQDTLEMLEQHGKGDTLLDLCWRVGWGEWLRRDCLSASRYEVHYLRRMSAWCGDHSMHRERNKKQRDLHLGLSCALA